MTWMIWIIWNDPYWKYMCCGFFVLFFLVGVFGGLMLGKLTLALSTLTASSQQSCLLVNWETESCFLQMHRSSIQICPWLKKLEMMTGNHPWASFYCMMCLQQWTGFSSRRHYIVYHQRFSSLEVFVSYNWWSKLTAEELKLFWFFLIFIQIWF